MKPVRIQRSMTILENGLKYLETELSELSSKSLKRETSLKRQMLMVFLNENTNLRKEEITKIFNRDRTTFYPSRRTVRNLIFSDPEVKETYEGLNKLINQ